MKKNMYYLLCVCCCCSVFAMETKEILILENHLSDKTAVVWDEKTSGSSVTSSCGIGTEIKKGEKQNFVIVVPSTGCNPSDNFIKLYVYKDDAIGNGEEIVISWGKTWDGIYANRYGDIGGICWLVKRTERGPIARIVLDELSKKASYRQEADRLINQSLSPGYILQSTGISANTSEH